MNNFIDIFSSKARVRILRTLYFQPQAIPLRHIAYISDLPVFSVQNAVGSLLEDEIINSLKKDNCVLFKLNKSSPFYTVLEQFFTIEINNRIRMEAKTFYQKAREALAFADAANIIFRHAKKKRSIK